MLQWRTRLATTRHTQKTRNRQEMRETSSKRRPKPRTDPGFMNAPAAIRLEDLSHSYGSRQALANLSLEVQSREIFVFLGPNGGGKTTLFRVLSTLIPQQTGTVEILGLDLRGQQLEIRRRLGVVFQAPSLD